MTFLYCDGIRIRDTDNTLENLTLKVVTGEKTIDQLAQHLQNLVA